MLEDVQLRVERDGLVEIVTVLTPPAEGFALDAFQPVDIDLALAKEDKRLRRKIVADDAHQRHFGEKTGGGREVARRASKDILRRTERSLHRIQRHRTNHENAHLSPFTALWVKRCPACFAYGKPACHRRLRRSPPRLCPSLLKGE